MERIKRNFGNFNFGSSSVLSWHNFLDANIKNDVNRNKKVFYYIEEEIGKYDYDETIKKLKCKTYINRPTFIKVYVFKNEKTGKITEVTNNNELNNLSYVTI